MRHIPHQVMSNSEEAAEPEEEVVFDTRNFHMHWVLRTFLPFLQPIRMSAEEGKLD